MKKGWITLLCASFTLTGHSVNDPVWPEHISAFHSEPRTACPSLGPGFAAVTIDTVANTYEKRQKLCGDELIHWERGVIEKGVALVKIVDGFAIALPGDKPEWQDILPTMSGRFFLDGDFLVEYSTTEEELLRYYLVFLDASPPICLMPHDREVNL